MAYKRYANHCVYEGDFSPVENQVWTKASTQRHTVFDVIVQAYGAMRARMQERVTIRQLSNLEDHILKDIGVPRSEIPTIARKIAENPGLDCRAYLG